MKISALFLLLVLTLAVEYETDVTTANATVTDTLRIEVVVGVVGVEIPATFDVELFGDVNPETVSNFKTLCLRTTTDVAD